MTNFLLLGIVFKYSEQSKFADNNQLKNDNMKHEIKKQIWISKQEQMLLVEYAHKTCLTESEYIRMLLRGVIPKEKPGQDFYVSMNQLSQFSEKLQTFAIQLRESGTCDVDDLQKEVNRWYRFQLAIEERFLAPEKVSWL